MTKGPRLSRAIDALPIWGEVAGRYSEDQLALLKALTLGRRASPSWSMLDLAPQWFASAEPIKGTERLVAPALTPASRAKFDALWAFSKDPRMRIRSDMVGYRTSVAEGCAAALLWEASFHKEWEGSFHEKFSRRLPDLVQAMDFDPLNDDIGAAVQRFSELAHPVYATLFDMRALDCVRIPETASEDLERAAKKGVESEPDALAP